jgi:integrase
MGLNQAYFRPVNYEVPGKKKKLPAVPTKKELLKLMAYVQDVRIGFSIFVGCFQGLRIGEMISLKWSEVNLKDGELIVLDGKNPRRKKSGYGKDRLVVINKMFLPIWQAWRAMNPEEEYVIPDFSDNGMRAPHNTLLRRFQKRLQIYLERAELLEVESVQSNGVERYKYHFHSFRHVCGTNLRRAGMKIEDVRELNDRIDECRKALC